MSHFLWVFSRHKVFDNLIKGKKGSPCVRSKIVRVKNIVKVSEKYEEEKWSRLHKYKFNKEYGIATKGVKKFALASQAGHVMWSLSILRPEKESAKHPPPRILFPFFLPSYKSWE